MNYTRKKFISSAAAASLFMGLNPFSVLAKSNLFPVPYSCDVNKELKIDGSLSDPNITYIGRWDKTDPLQYHSHWGGAYLKTLFTGTSINIQLGADTMLVVSIDNEAPRGVNGKQGVTDLTDGHLKEGNHSLMVGSAGQNYELSLQALVLGTGGETALTKGIPLIEFIGDSITTGTGPARISTVNYAWNTAVALGCDHAQIAFSGIALTTGFGCLKDKTGMDQQYFQLKNFNHLRDEPQADWDFSYKPSLVVINLGQNDQCGKEPEPLFTESMIGFLRKLRLRFATAPVALLRPFSGAYAASIESAVVTLNKGGDKMVQYIDTTGWVDKDDYTDGIHPNGTGGQKISGNLVPLLRPLLKTL